MALQDDLKSIDSSIRRDFQENSAENKYSVGRRVARGAGFEPARPKGPQA